MFWFHLQWTNNLFSVVAKSNAENFVDCSLIEAGTDKLRYVQWTQSQGIHGTLKRFPLIVVAQKQSVDNSQTNIQETDVRQTVNVASQQQQQ